MKAEHFDQWITEEFERGVYDQFVQVEDGDLVLDLGCSKGWFFKYHENKRIQYIGIDGDLKCLGEFADALEPGDECCLLHLALAYESKPMRFESFLYQGTVSQVQGISVRDLFRLIGRRIDFLKFDIEGWEAVLWDTDEAYDLFKKTVHRFTGELHFGEGANPNLLAGLKRLRDDPSITLKLFSLDKVPITDYFWDHTDYYRQIIISGMVEPEKANPFWRVYEGIERRKGILENISCNFIDGPHVNISGTGGVYDVSFVDEDANECVYKSQLAIEPGPGLFSRAFRQYFTRWKIAVTREEGKTVFEERLNLRGRRVYIAFDSRALGDTLAWIPYAEEFRLKHECGVIVSTFSWNNLFRKAYPKIQFIEPGEIVPNLYAKYVVGCLTPSNRDLSPWPWYEQPLQAVAAGILGLPYQEIRPKLSVTPKRWKERRYVCIGTETTARAKFWLRDGGWEDVINRLREQGYTVLNISKNPRRIEGAFTLEESPIEEVASNLAGAEFFIGLPSGLSWLAWALQVPVVMISGFSPPWVEFQEGRVHVGPPEGKCNGCYSVYERGFDNGDLAYCPRMGKTSRAFECTKSITPEAVIKAINQIQSKL